MHFVEEARDTALIEQINGADRAVSLFGDDDFRLAALFTFGIIVFVAVNKHNQVGVLLN